MDKVTGKLTVFFEKPFWVGVFERVDGERLSACKITFGAEPKDYEVWDFLLKNYCNLKFSPSVEVIVKKAGSNPKRIRRDAGKQTSMEGIGTRSWQALQLQREERKTERRSVSKAQRLAEQERRYELKQQKRKEKHRGR